MQGKNFLSTSEEEFAAETVVANAEIGVSGKHQDVILGQRHHFILDLFSAYDHASTDHSATRKRQISEGRAKRRKRRAETR